MVEEQVQATQEPGTEVKPENKQEGALTQGEQKQKIPKSTTGTAPGGYWSIRAAKHVGRNVGKYVTSIIFGVVAGVEGTLYVQGYMQNRADGKYAQVLDLKGAHALGIESDSVLTPIIEFDPETGRIVRGRPIRGKRESLVAILDPNNSDPNEFDTVYVMGYDEKSGTNIRHPYVSEVRIVPGIPADPNDPSKSGRCESVILGPRVRIMTNKPIPGYTAARRGGQRR